MKDKVYIFGAYRALQKDGKTGFGNFLHQNENTPSIEQLVEALKKDKPPIESVVITNLQFLTKEQNYALKGEKPDEQQSDLLNKKVTDLNLSVRTINICLSNGLNTVRDICRIAKTDWLKFRNGGKMSLSEIDDFLKDNGLTWGMKV